MLAGGGYLAYTQFLAGPSGPAAPIHSYIDAATAGNQEGVEAAVHPNSPERSSLIQSASFLDGMDASIESTEVVSQTEERAMVEATASMGGQESSTSTFEVRKYEGDWKLWSTG